jgi:hypothetical protein
VHISQNVDPIGGCLLYNVPHDTKIAFIVNTSLWFHTRPHDTSGGVLEYVTICFMIFGVDLQVPGFATDEWAARHLDVEHSNQLPSSIRSP